MSDDPEIQVLETVADEYRRRGWWSTDTVGTLISRRAELTPDDVAYIDSRRAWSWSDYDRSAWRLAAVLDELIDPGQRVAIFLPDGGWQHVSYVATERASAIAVGVPGRAATTEIAHVLARTGARVMVVPASVRDRSAHDFIDELRGLGHQIDAYVVVDGADEITVWPAPASGPPSPLPDATSSRGLGPADVWLLNITSGTTGSPKAVIQTQNRWFYLARLAAEAARIDADDRLLCAIPGPYGFGIWTGHVLPTLTGSTCCLIERFDPATTLQALSDRRITVLACVTTQLVMMMNDPLFEKLDLSHLRVVFTGGEMVPEVHARRWEHATGSVVLQFYGSNEVGPLSCTRLDDDEHTRLTTAGQIVPGLTWQLVDEMADHDDRGPIRVGQLAVSGPGVHGGYWDDPAANRELRTADGSFLMPDVVAVDDDDNVRIVGRKADIIIRGGKNVSAAVVEREVSTCSGVETAVAVPVADETFGERIGVAIVPTNDGERLDLAALSHELSQRGVSKEYHPERLRIVDRIPLSLGGKTDKQWVKSLFDERRGGDGAA